MAYNEFYINNNQNFRFFIRHWVPETQPKGMVMLLHGLSDHGDRFRFVGEAFVNAGFVFVAPDLRGNGKSDGKRGHFDSLDQVMDDIHFLMNENSKLYPGIPVILYSQSMGGNLAINFTLRFPDEIACTVASSPWLTLAKPPADFVQKIAAFLVKITPSLLIPNGLKSADLCHDKQICQAYDNDPLLHWKVSLSAFFIIKNAGEWAIQHASGLKIPLLLLHSKADPITSFMSSVQFAENSNTNLTFLKYKDEFHELHNESIKDEVVGNIIEWIKQHFQKV